MIDRNSGYLRMHFENRLNDLVQFKKTEGRWPSNRSTNKKEKSLGDWCHKMKAKHSKRELESYKYKMLSRIGYSMTPLADNWNTNFTTLKKYILKKNDLPPSNTKLYSFAYNQYRMWAKLSNKKKKLLTLIGFMTFWKKRKEKDEVQWNATFKEVVRFVKKHGKLPSRKTNAKLEWWVSKYRQQLKRGELSKEYQELFQNAGIDLLARSFTKRTEPWEKRCEKLKSFYSKYKRWPNSEKKTERSLYYWYVWQRIKFENGKLCPEQIKKLDAIHPNWMTRRKEVSPSSKKRSFTKVTSY